MTRLSCMHDRRSGERTHDHGSSVLMDMPSPRRWPSTNALSPLPNKEIPPGVPADRAARPLGVRRADIGKQFDVPCEPGNGGLLAEIRGNPAQRAVSGRLISGGLCSDKIYFAQNKFYYCKVLRGPFRVRVSTRTAGRLPVVTRAIRIARLQASIRWRCRQSISASSVRPSQRSAGVRTSGSAGRAPVEAHAAGASVAELRMAMGLGRHAGRGGDGTGIGWCWADATWLH